MSKNRIEDYNKLFRSPSTPLPLKDSKKQFRLTWKDLTYSASRPFTRKTKIILNHVSGFFESGQITGIMGPSGCGKSTFLDCIAGHKRTGLTGSITISTENEVRFAFIVQDNHLLPRLTVRESLIFASKLKNGSNADHRLIANQVIDKLLLQTCADNYPKRCSGGQQKRVLIGLELVSKPNILILDEPTSGLDSVTAWQLVNTMIELTQQSDPVAVVLTIHQPSAKLFNLFNRIYLLSSEGQCIYNGAPQSMLSLFSEVGLKCPKFTNISDFGLEVASKDYGRAKMLTLSTIMNIEAMNWPEGGHTIQLNRNYNTLTNIYHLTIRSIISLTRDPYNLPIRASGYLFSGIMISILFGLDVGVLDGCSHDFIIDGSEKLFDKWKNASQRLFDNVALMAFTTQFAWFGGIFPVLLVIPMELNVFRQEYGNGYYSGFSYFMSKMLSDSLFNLILPNLGCIPLFFMTGQYYESAGRVLSFVLIFILLTFNATSLGFMIGSAFADFPQVIPFVGFLTFVPLILLSGAMIPVRLMGTFFRGLSYTAYARFGFESLVINCYGFDRCNQNRVDTNRTDLLSMITTEQMLEIAGSDKLDPGLLLDTLNGLTGGLLQEDDRAIVLESIKLNESDYYFSIAWLVLHLIVFRVLTYLFIQRMTRY